MEPTERVSYLEAVDSVLCPLGFKRAKNSQEWRRIVSTDCQWVHLNFGLAMANPSVGVLYSDVQKAWGNIPGAVFDTSVVLSCAADAGLESLLHPSPASIADDIQAYALDALETLRDRDAVVERLKGNDVEDWPVPSYSHRIRLLPLIIAQAGKSQEALSVAETFLPQSVGKDQLLPGYSEYLEALKRGLAV